MKVVIEGNIGSGKSSVISRLCAEARIPVFLEPVDEWKEWLSHFYADPARWGMSFNLNVLMSFNKWKDNNFFAIYERSPLSNRHIFCQLQHDQNRLTDLELELFDKVYEKLSWVPDVIIYIRTDPKVSMERMKKRARECESTVPLDYLNAVHNKYETLLGNSKNTGYLDSKYSDKKKTQIITVDGNKSADEVYNEVYACVKRFMS